MTSRQSNGHVPPKSFDRIGGASYENEAQIRLRTGQLASLRNRKAGYQRRNS
jgi:hypothetical protein